MARRCSPTRLSGALSARGRSLRSRKSRARTSARSSLRWDRCAGRPPALVDRAEARTPAPPASRTEVKPRSVRWLPCGHQAQVAGRHGVICGIAASIVCQCTSISPGSTACPGGPARARLPPWRTPAQVGDALALDQHLHALARRRARAVEQAQVGQQQRASVIGQRGRPAIAAEGRVKGASMLRQNGGATGPRSRTRWCSRWHCALWRAHWRARSRPRIRENGEEESER